MHGRLWYDMNEDVYRRAWKGVWCVQNWTSEWSGAIIAVDWREQNEF